MGVINGGGGGIVAAAAFAVSAAAAAAAFSAAAEAGLGGAGPSSQNTAWYPSRVTVPQWELPTRAIVSTKMHQAWPGFEVSSWIICAMRRCMGGMGLCPRTLLLGPSLLSDPVHGFPTSSFFTVCAWDGLEVWVWLGGPWGGEVLHRCYLSW